MGVPRNLLLGSPPAPALATAFERAIVVLRAAGATVLDPLNIPNATAEALVTRRNDALAVLAADFKADLRAYLVQLATKRPARGLSRPQYGPPGPITGAAVRHRVGAVPDPPPARPRARRPRGRHGPAAQPQPGRAGAAVGLGGHAAGARGLPGRQRAAGRVPRERERRAGRAERDGGAGAEHAVRHRGSWGTCGRRRGCWDRRMGLSSGQR